MTLDTHTHTELSQPACDLQVLTQHLERIPAVVTYVGSSCTCVYSGAGKSVPSGVIKPIAVHSTQAFAERSPHGAAAHRLDLSRVPPDFITMLLQSMSLRDRFTCALVCKAWAEAATAATRSIILEHWMKDLSCLQCWLEKHGNQIEVLQLHKCVKAAVLTALACPQLQDLLLRAHVFRGLRTDTRVWSDIAAATKLTSVTLECLTTASQQADVVSALTALPDLEQLTWSSVECSRQLELTDSLLLQKLTKLTVLRLDYVAEAEALEHLGGLTRLQDLSLAVTIDWGAAGCPGLQELKALTRLEMPHLFAGIPASVNQLTALQQLNVTRATPTALNELSALTGLTQLRVEQLLYLSPESSPVQLPSLQRLEVGNGENDTMPVSFFASCTQLRLLRLRDINLSPGILAATTMLEDLILISCRVSATDEAAGAASWQQLFPGPGQLPHLTSLAIVYSLGKDLLLADLECVVACCSNLQKLHLNTLPDNCAATLARLPGLTSLSIWLASDQQCSSIGQLTGLRKLLLTQPEKVSVAGLVQLTTLKELTCLGLRYGFCPDKVEPALWKQMLDKVLDCGPAITDKAPAGQPSDVPAQLLRACATADVNDS